MNEDFIKRLYDHLDISSKGIKIEDFTNDLRDTDFQKRVFDQAKIADRGIAFEDFQKDLTGSMLTNNQRNLLDTVADKEASDYNVIVGGGTFDDYSKHPNIVGMVTAFGPSTAAGKYQITKSTWDKVAPKLGLTDFSPESQDQAALYLAQERFKGKTGKDLDTALDSTDDKDIEEIRNVLGGSGSDTLWQGLQNDKTFNTRYNQRRGLVDTQGSAKDPVGLAGVSYGDGIDQSKFDQTTLDNFYIQAGGDPSKEKYTTAIRKIGNGSSGYRFDFQDSKGTKSYNFVDKNANIIDRVSVGITNGLLAFGSGTASTVGAITGLIEDATELVTKGDTNFDKTFDYADNSVMDYLNNAKIHSEKTESYKSAEERTVIAAENKDAIGQILAQLSKVGYAEWWQDSASDMAGSMASFILPGMAVGKMVKGSTIASRFLAKGIGTNLAEKSVQYLVGDSIMSGSEAAMEAGAVFEDVKKNLMDKGLSEEEAIKQAADAASENWGINYVGLMGTNAIQMGGFLGKLSSSTNGLVRAAVNIGAPILSEGFEEAFQTNAQRYSTNKGSNEPYNEGKDTGVLDSGLFNTDGAMGGTLQSVYKTLMEGDAETWESAIGGALMGGGGSILGTGKSVYDLYKVEKPLMSKINNSLVLSPNDIYKTKEDGSLYYNEQGKPQIDPTKHFSNIKAINTINSIDALTEEAFNNNNAEAIKFLHTGKIASIAHDYLTKSEDGNIEALENAVNNSMTKKDYEKNKLSEFYSFEEFKSIRKNVLETAKNNYEKVYSDPKLKLQSAEYKQGIYHNLVQQDLANKEIERYTNQLEIFKTKESKLNSLEKETKKDLETKITSLESYKSQLETSFENFTKAKNKDAKETKAEEIKVEAAEATKQGKPVEEILANKTTEETKAAKEGITEANTQAIKDELDTYNSPQQYKEAIKNNPDHAKLIADHYNEKLTKQTKTPLTNVSQIPTRYGQENTFLQEHEEEKIGKEFNKILDNKENLGEEVANYEKLKADPNFKFTPDPELVHLGNHILGGGTVATYTQTFNQDNLQDPLLQKAIDKVNNIKEAPVKKETVSTSKPVTKKERKKKEKKTELDLKKEDIEKRRQEELKVETKAERRYRTYSK
jgi:muramidase (phage lysozyme)